MNLIINETARVLSHPPQIGLIVLPRNLFFYWFLLDDIVHEIFDCYRHPRRGDYIEYDIIDHLKAAQYSYRLITPDDLDVPWAPDGRELWDKFGEVRHDDIFADPNLYILLANLERDYLELSPFCVAFGCDMPTVSEQLLDLGEDSLQLYRGSHFNDFLEVQIPLNREFSYAVKKLTAGIILFMEKNSFPRQKELLSAVVVAGGASETALDALGRALREALPFVNSTRFRDNLDPASVFSLGAAAPSRNIRLYDEQHDCDCDGPERLRDREGLPLDDKFPCNRSWIRGPGLL